MDDDFSLGVRLNRLERHLLRMDQQRALTGRSPHPESLAAIHALRQKYSPILHLAPTPCTVLGEQDGIVRFRVAGHDFLTSMAEDEFYHESRLLSFLDGDRFNDDMYYRRLAIIHARDGVSPYYNC